MELQAIIETQNAISASGLDLDSIMALLCDRAQELLGAEGAAVLLAADDQNLR